MPNFCMSGSIRARTGFASAAEQGWVVQWGGLGGGGYRGAKRAGWRVIGEGHGSWHPILIEDTPRKVYIF
jgi:hypothetical protein